MRLVQATVPYGVLEGVTERLDEHGVDYFAMDETATDDYVAVLYFSVPREELESLLSGLYETGLDAEDHVSVIDSEVDLFGRAEASPGTREGHKGVAGGELVGRTEELLPNVRTYVSMIVLSVIVATTGLLLDSVAVVVGAMVIAPLYGPAVSTSVGTVVGNRRLFTRGIELQVIGVVIAVAGATLFAWFLKVGYLSPAGLAITSTPQIASRLSPDILSLVVALVAGVAGILGMATSTRVTLVGVMMAAALLPPAAVVGIGIAWWEPPVAVHAAALLAVNVLAINFAGLVTLWYLGYRPHSRIQLSQTRRHLAKRAGLLLVGIVLVSGLLVSVSYQNVQQSQLEQSIGDQVAELLDEERYANVSLVNVKAIEQQGTVLSETDRVVVTIGRPPDQPRPGLRYEIDDLVRDETEADVAVDVRVVLVYTETWDTDVSNPTATIPGME
ncbi:TIGR00341 family protein [Halomicrobium salinisoli]|uniref:TIGR00341 family protein n=1 Tax=Halomicrobium salinisoli TaxID=2878391 RepID=UPI001CEFB7DB|nr:TIGR00341 family protein [Halomicrobium salinisoli]